MHAFSSINPPVGLFLPRHVVYLCLLVLALVLAGCGPSPDRHDGVELVLSTPELAPETTFEVRFDQPIVRAEQIGATQSVSALVFTPPVKGSFVWTSSRSGLLTPDEPLTLATEYVATLHPKLAGADGKPVTAKLRRALRTPAFGLLEWDGPAESTNAPAQPDYALWFNAEVFPGEVGRHLGFVDNRRQWVPAKALPGRPMDSPRSWRGPRLSWDQRFAQARRPTGPGPEVPEDPDERTALNLVLVSPQRPLPAGQGWRLVLNSGYRSADGKYRAVETTEIPLGDVQNMAVDAAEITHVLNRGPRLELRFSRYLDESLTNSWTNWVVVAPAVKELNAVVQGSKLMLPGKWERGREYKIAVSRGLPSGDGLRLAANFGETLNVPPVPPRLYFPAFSAEQYAAGRRSISLLAVNVTSVRVRAKLLDPATAIHALRGYESYVKENRYYEAEAFRRVDYNMVPGRTVLTETFPLFPPPDECGELKIDWNRVLKGRKTGMVFLDAERVSESSTEARLGTQCVIQLTDLGIVWKMGGGELRAYVFSYETAQPVPGARVALFTDENERIAEATTDTAGQAVLKQPNEAVWLMATAGEDAHALMINRDSINQWTFSETRGNYENWENSGTSRLALFTDRDVYRPGETILYKLIQRELEDDGLHIRAGTTGIVTCADSGGRQFFSTNLVLSALGSFDGAVPVPEGSRGTYLLSATLRGGEIERRRSITIADYRPAAFEVRADMKPEYEPGATLEVPVSARYQFGAALQNAQLKWNLSASETDFEPAGFDEYRFHPEREGEDWQPAPLDFQTNGAGQLTVSSNTVIRALLPQSPSGRPAEAGLYLQVTDLNQQTITRYASARQHNADFYLGFKQEEHVVGAGQEVPLRVIAVGKDGRPWPSAVKAKATLSRVRWESVQVQGAGLSVRYRNKAFLTPILEKEIEIPPVTAPFSQDPNFPREIDGFALTGWSAAEAGQHVLTLTSTDSAGRSVCNSASFHVTTESRLAWNYRDDVQVKLVADKLVYHPGEKATLLVKAPFSGQALVTVEREKVLRSFVTKLEGNAPAIEVPIEPGDAPNVFVFVALIRGGSQSTREIKAPEYRLGYSCLQVEAPDRRLKVDVLSSKTNCLPGEVISVTAQVRNAASQPVADAEVTLYAVDEGVLSLTDYTVPDLYETFLQRRDLAVRSGITLPFLLSENPEELSFHNKGYLGGGGGMERVRQRFLACAFWKGALRTAADGLAKVEFTAPDSITRYRVVAVVHTAAHQFGQATAQFSVSKPVMIEPALPLFAHVGDCLQVRAIVFNQTATPSEIAVSLELDALAATPGSGALTQNVTVPAGSAAPVEFPIEFKVDGSSAWTWRARPVQSGAENYTDAVRSTIEVRSPLPLLRESRMITQTSAETNLLASANPQLLEGKGTIRVRIADTQLVALGEAVRHLLTYPYGCAEQTSSSLLPWIVLQRSPDLLPLVDRSPKESAAAAEAGIRRLLSMQTGSGGLGYWPNDPHPNHWVSAYGALVLTLGREAGLPVPKTDLDLLLSYLSQQLRVDHDPDTQCLALYVLALAGKAEPAYHTTWFEKRAQLSREGRAFLALAAGIKDPATPMTAGLLEVKAVKETTAAPFAGTTREPAAELLARTALQPASIVTKKLFEQLLDSQQNGHWGTTQGNAWSMLAMAEYIKASENRSESTKATLHWGEQARSVDFGEGCHLISETFPLDPKLGTEPMTLKKTGARSLYIQVTLDARLATQPQTAQDHGYALQRRYWKLDDQNVPSPLENLAVGDRVLVSLRVSIPKAAQYVALEDPLPALFEPVHAQFKTQQTAPAKIKILQDGDAFELPADFWEVRADRMLYFANQLQPGTYVVRYLARVRTKGSALSPGTKAESMYDPGRFGLAEPHRMQVN